MSTQANKRNLTDTETAARFIQALRACERDGDIEPLVLLFSETCQIGNLRTHQPHHGHDGVRAFWRDYRQSFREVHSHFTHVSGRPPLLALEWTSEGTLRNGKPVTYRGVSLLEVDNGMIKRFHAYFDTAALAEHHEAAAPEDRSAAA